MHYFGDALVHVIIFTALLEFRIKLCINKMLAIR